MSGTSVVHSKLNICLETNDALKAKISNYHLLPQLSSAHGTFFIIQTMLVSLFPMSSSRKGKILEANELQLKGIFNENSL